MNHTTMGKKSQVFGEFWMVPKNIPGVSLQARFIIGMLQTFSNGENESWPSQQRIAEEIGVGIRSVQRYLDELVTAGFIEIVQRGLQRTNVYSLTRQIGVSGHDTTVVSGGDMDDVSGGDTTVVSFYIGKEHKEKNTIKDRGISEPPLAPPKEFSRTFFEDNETREKIMGYFLEKGVPENLLRQEVSKFVAYWTEPNSTGTKQRWQMQKTFEVKRRLVTWVQNVSKFSHTEINRETKGIIL